MKREGSIVFHDTGIGVWEESVDEEKFMPVYGSIIRFLRNRGFRVGKDPETKRRFPSLQNRTHSGRKGALEIHLGLCGRHIEISFFQNVVFENLNGGRYDFGKYEKMPYLIRKSFLNEASRLIDFLVEHYGYSFGKGLTRSEGPSLERILAGKRGIADPLERFNNLWTPGRFRRDESGWPVPDEFDRGCNVDREKVPLRNGMFRYWRDYDGRLKRGRVYTNMNTMWQLVYGPGVEDRTWVSCCALFTLQPSDHRGRYFTEGFRRGKLEKALDAAVKDMRFERAAVLRDLLFGKAKAGAA